MTDLLVGVEVLESGLTLPSSWCTDRNHFELEQRLILERSWICVGHMRQLARPSDYLTAMIGTVRSS